MSESVAIPLLNWSEPAWVDLADFTKVVEPLDTTWSYHRSRGGRGVPYVVANSFRRLQLPTRYLARLVLSAPTDLQVDHIDGDTLNNRRSNLRLATRRQNMLNRPGWRNAGCKGVYKVGSKFVARLQNVYLGTFDTFEEAQAVRLAAVNVDRDADFYRTEVA